MRVDKLDQQVKKFVAYFRVSTARQIEAATIVQAGWRAVSQRDRLLHELRTFVIETTLTGHSELELMRAARVRGYKINLVYVKTSSAELSNGLAALRVAPDGHDAAEHAIFRRFGRSLEHLPCRDQGK